MNATQYKTRRPARRTARRGFTLLEIIVVVVIIALLATMVAPRLFDNIGRSRVRVATSGVASIAQQVRIYMSDENLSRLPNNFNLNALVPKYLRAKDLIDPWGNPFVIIIPGDENPDFDIVSFGADGVPGGDGEDADIVN
ncbi:MAG TPA: type II secretion system protein GspG [Phycisphaerales bacterium]|nr:type II secretion system protein GspG [Phycisphaerales bacterium]HRQ75053.1 type II secretion system protein GspG [Phycisphaerales bacterium]